MQDIDSFIALNRFGFGAGLGDAARLAGDARGWLASQIERHPRVPRSLTRFDSADAILTRLRHGFFEGAEARGMAVRAGYREAFFPEVMARARIMAATPTPLVERLHLFWANHFTVSLSKFQTGPAIPAYEREAIRPHLFGRFADMLRAVVQHPSMLIYLDNVASIGPNSARGQRRIASGRAANTLNENLAREVLELHTLGVQGGYGQEDVIALARALTGWTYGADRPPREGRPFHGRFVFRPALHEPGPKTVLGRTYPEGGQDEGEAILDDLARHPSTARHIATKLVRHFIADTPDAADIDALSRVFLDTDGDLMALTRALIARPSAWSEPLAKVKTHQEFVIAVHRALGIREVRREAYVRPLRLMGQGPHAAPSPQGWGDLTGDWLSPEGLLLRVEWAHAFAHGIGRIGWQPARLLDEVIGPVAQDVTERAVAGAPTGPEALAMVFASPEFQRR
ncbi:MAG: DUF1800 family protein [Pararhodobacter sp.]